jgi:hypothetical protein
MFHINSASFDNLQLSGSVVGTLSASVNFTNDIDKIVNHYNNWVYPNQVLWGGVPSTLHKVKKVNNLFL